MDHISCKSLRMSILWPFKVQGHVRVTPSTTPSCASQEETVMYQHSCGWGFLLSIVPAYTFGMYTNSNYNVVTHGNWVISLFNTTWWSDSCNDFLDPGSTKLHGCGILIINALPLFHITMLQSSNNFCCRYLWVFFLFCVAFSNVKLMSWLPSCV